MRLALKPGRIQPGGAVKRPLRRLLDKARYGVRKRTGEVAGADLAVGQRPSPIRSSANGSTTAASAAAAAEDLRSLAVARRASPLPPPELPGDPVELAVPVSFSLR